MRQSRKTQRAGWIVGQGREAVLCAEHTPKWGTQGSLGETTLADMKLDLPSLSLLLGKIPFQKHELQYPTYCFKIRTLGGNKFLSGISFLFSPHHSRGQEYFWNKVLNSKIKQKMRDRVYTSSFLFLCFQSGQWSFRFPLQPPPTPKHAALYTASQPGGNVSYLCARTGVSLSGCRVTPTPSEFSTP